MLTLLNKFAKSKDGNFSTIFALLSFVLAGGASIAVTYYTISHERSELQDNLDAAVLAGMSLGHSATDQQRIDTAASIMAQRSLKFGTSAGSRISTSSDSSKFRVVNSMVVGDANSDVPNMLSSLIGNEATKVTVNAAAEKKSSDPVCLHALNPLLTGSIQLYGTASLKANCVVMADSSNSTGMMTWGKTTFATAKQFGVTGAYKGNFEPKPVVDVTPLTDQFADLPIPRAGPCADVSSKLMKVDVELDPGTYCGGLSISPNSNVSLRPGIYIFKDGPLSVTANSTLKGEEVTLAFVGENAILNANSNSVINLTSPIIGDYANIQFISDRELNGNSKNEEWTTLSSTNLTFDGLMYLPEQDIWIKGGSNVQGKSPTMIIVADQIWVQDSSTLDISQENSRDIKLKGKNTGFQFAARLVE